MRARYQLIPAMTLALLLAMPSAWAAAGRGFPTLETVGHLGGWVNAAAVEGNYAFLCRANVLAIVDLASAPARQLAFLEFPDEPTRIALAAGRAYLTCRGTLEVVEVSDPTAPVRLSTRNLLPAEASVASLEAAGDYLYLVERGAGLRVVDVSDPLSPAVVAALDGAGFEDVFLSGGHAYVASTDGELRIFALTDPAAPAALAALPIAGAHEVFVAGDLALVAGGIDQPLTLVDVSQPDNPQAVSVFGSPGDGYEKLAAEGDHAYVVTIDLRFQIVDVSTPAAPSLVGELDLEGFDPGSLQVAAGTLHATANGRFLVVDVTNPADPVPVAGLEAPEEILDLDLGAGSLYLASADRIWRYDLSVPASPALVSSFMPAGLSPANPIFRVAAAGERVVSAALDGTVRVFDWSAPGQAVETGSLALGVLTMEMVLAGNRVYVVHDDGTLRGLGIRPDGSLVALGSLAIPGQGRDLFVAAGEILYAVAATGEAAGFLEIVDFSDPAAPTSLSRTAIGGQPSSVEVAGQTAFVAGNRTDGSWSLAAFAVGDPAHPVPAGAVSEPGKVRRVRGLGENLLIAGVPGGSLHTYRYDAATGALAAGPVHPIPEAGELAFLPLGNTSYVFSLNGYLCLSQLVTYGSKGSYVTRVTGDGGGEVILTMAVEPAVAAEEGCTTDPSPGSHDFTAGEEVSLSALANSERGWNFLEWSGDAAGTAPETSLVMDEDKDAVAHFVQPILTLSAEGPPRLVCPPGPGEAIPMATASLCVNEVDDWMVTTVSFHGFGSGHEVRDLDRVELTVRGRTLSGRYQADDGAVSFAVSEVVPAGTCLPLSLAYRFALGDETCPFEPVKDFGVRIGAGDVAAGPLNFDAFLKLPPEPFRVDGATVACVHNTPRRLGFSGIQAAINAPETQDGDVVEICAGIYPEAVEVTRRLTVRSFQGPEMTVVDPGAITTRSRDLPTGDSSGVVVVRQNGVTIQGLSLRNGDNGLVVPGFSDVTIGGEDPTARNVVGENREDGIRIEGATATGISILNNYVGTDPSGDSPRPNGRHGIALSYADGNQIRDNLIAGNGGNGINLYAADDTGIFGNRIGIGSGGAELGNRGGGILIHGSSGNLVGDEEDGRNVIAFNGDPSSTQPGDGYGIGIISGTGNRLVGNSIFANHGLGIDLSRGGVRTDGITPNDEMQDLDLGANDLQNFPILTSLPGGSDGWATFLVTLHSRPDHQFQLDFYTNSECDPSGHGEGREHVFSLTSEMTRTDAAGDLSFELDQDPEDALLTATATDAAGDTSEFSPCAGAVVVAVSSEPALRVAPGEIVRYTVEASTSQPSLIPPEGFTVRFPVPRYAEFFPASARSESGRVEAGEQEIVWRLPRLEGGTTAVLTFAFQISCDVVTLHSNQDYPQEFVLRGWVVIGSGELPIRHSLELLRPDLVITGLEVAQTIQNLDNDVRPLQRKPVVARAFIQARYPEDRVGCDVANVPGTWSMDGQIVFDEDSLNALGSPATGRPSLGERGRPRPGPDVRVGPHAMQLIRPPRFIPQAPAHTFSIHVNPECTRVDAVCTVAGNRQTVTLPFDDEPPLRLLLYRLGYREDATQEFQFVSAETAAGIKANVGRILPVDGTEDSPEYAIRQYRLGEFAREALCTRDGLSFARVRLGLAVLTGEEEGTVPTDAHVYGITMEDCEQGTTGLNGGRFAVGVADLSTVLHELAHQFGREHVEAVEPGSDCDKASPPYQPYPYLNGRLSNQLEPCNGQTFYGSDGVNGVIPPGNASENYAFDVMTYCSNTWVSDFTWNYIRAKHPLPDDDRARVKWQQEARPLAVAGVVNLTRARVELDPFYQLSEPAQLAIVAASDFEIRLLAGATVLASFPIEVDGWTDPRPGQDLLGGFAALVPWIAGTTRIELLHRGEVLGGRDRSPASPTLSLEPPAPPADSGAPWTLRWTAADADGDRLSFLVLYSDDGGETWSVLALGLSDSRLELAPGEVAGSDRARFRILASDGVNTAAATSGLFTVPRSAPQAFILHPAADLVVAAGTPVGLEGAASDAEDGPLPDPALIWTDAAGTQLGWGPGLVLRRLSEGEHTITLTAIDGDGMTAAASVRITVAPAAVVHGTVSFSSDLYPALRTAPAAQVVVRRRGGTAGAVSVELATADASAVADEDYLPVAATLSWEDGDGAPKLVEIPLLSGSGETEEKLFLVRLRSPIGGAAVEEPQTAAVVVREAPATEIPTLTPWALGLLALVLAAAGWRILMVSPPGLLRRRP